MKSIRIVIVFFFKAQQQCIIVMRHGERLDFAKGQGRQFDPPLTEGGRIDAYQTASRYREKVRIYIEMHASMNSTEFW